MKDVPEIRFKGFTDAWEQRKLGEVADINPKSTNLPEQFEYVDLESVDGTSMISHRTEHRDSAPSRAQRIAKRGDVFYQTVRPYQKNNYFFDLPHDNYVFSTGYAQLRPKGDSYFLFSRLQEEKFVADVLDKCTGTSYPAINSNDLAQMDIEIAINLPEQTSIGNFFHTLDNIITLYKRKANCLKQLKKAYLQRMFPQDGETLPKIRFAGFTGEWRETRVGDIFEITRGQVLAATKVSIEKNEGNIYPVYSSQTKNNGLLGYYNDFLFDTAITWTTDGANAGTVNFRKGKFYSTNVNGVLLSKKGFANQCIAEILNLVAWKFVSKVGNPKLMNNVMAEIKITIPSIREQTSISIFFRNLDEQITAQQTKLDNLKELKSAYLQKMFV